MAYNGSSWSLSHGNWIYNCICDQRLSPLKLQVRIPLMARCTRYNFVWSSLLVTCDRSVVFSGYSGFLHQKNWPPRYNWNIVESGVKHHTWLLMKKPNLIFYLSLYWESVQSLFFTFVAIANCIEVVKQWVNASNQSYTTQTNLILSMHNIVHISTLFTATGCFKINQCSLIYKE